MNGWGNGWQELMLTAADYLTGGGWVVLPLSILSLWLWSLIFYKLRQIARFRPKRGAARAGWWSKVPALTGPAGSEELESARLRLEARLDSQVKTILVLASVAPLLGLLGTVTGMITTFEVISRFGTGNAKALAGGISEALITTQLGLMVALPGLFLGNLIRRRVEKIKARIRGYCLSLVRTGEGNPR